jgi:hypothetical protein
MITAYFFILEFSPADLGSHVVLDHLSSMAIKYYAIV